MLIGRQADYCQAGLKGGVSTHQGLAWLLLVPCSLLFAWEYAFTDEVGISQMSPDFFRI